MQRALRLLALARTRDAFRLLSSLCLVKSYSVSCAKQFSICSGQLHSTFSLYDENSDLLRLGVACRQFHLWATRWVDLWTTRWVDLRTTTASVTPMAPTRTLALAPALAPAPAPARLLEVEATVGAIEATVGAGWMPRTASCAPWSGSVARASGWQLPGTGQAVRTRRSETSGWPTGATGSAHSPVDQPIR
eukprot:SAG11_NODE_2780_length_2977_cov_16.909344_3_plen_191_part_00